MFDHAVIAVTVENEQTSVTKHFASFETRGNWIAQLFTHNKVSLGVRSLKCTENYCHITVYSKKGINLTHINAMGKSLFTRLVGLNSIFARDP